MKKHFLLYCLFFVIAISCTKEDNDLNKETELSNKLNNMTEKEVEEYAASIGAVTLEQLLKESITTLIAKENPEAAKHRENQANLIKDKEINQIYTITGYKGSVDLISNRKVIIRNSPIGIASGVYYADTHEVRNQVTLPAGTIGVTMPSPKCGFDPLNKDNSLQQGCMTYGQTGNTFYMKTIAYYVSHDSSGKKIGLWNPTLSSLEWNYAYVD